MLAFTRRPSTESRALRGSCRSHSDVVMLFCPSFAQSKRFLHTDQLISRLRRVEPATCCSHDKLHSHVVGTRDRERVQVRCSDLVGSDLPHPLIDLRQIAASVKVPGLGDERLEVS